MGEPHALGSSRGASLSCQRTTFSFTSGRISCVRFARFRPIPVSEEYPKGEVIGIAMLSCQRTTACFYGHFRHELE